MLSGKQKVKKGEQVKLEGNFASNLSEKNRNKDFGFHTLSYHISEACKVVEIKVWNKN